MVIYSLSQILSEAGGPGNERLRAGGRGLGLKPKTKVEVKRRS